ncbi:hypothetical protein AVEN_243621-1 [Araneus ventricosus]|uniref:THAP-type domain-containing protein n=1 Tax=Araneus ventricosus TaxID=182803 RepID=A0A4Y2A4V6_ARAVE|nr:hypothetical protein AVEN_243621-1 [Araneus ventricosus]
MNDPFWSETGLTSSLPKQQRVYAVLRSRYRSFAFFLYFPTIASDKIMSKRYKYCIVPECAKTTITAPDTLFMNVPNNDVLRKKWCKAMKRDGKVNPKFSASSVLHVCGNHFDVSN